MFRLDQQSAIITGGGSGIGKAIAQVFAQQGATVHILDLDEANASQTVHEIKNAGYQAHAHLCDISNQLNVDQVIESIPAAQILVNCAGIAHVGTAANTSEADFTKVFRINVQGTYNCLHAMIPLLLERGGGVILNLASIAAIVGITDRFAYSMSKGAVHAMTLSVARDYLSNQIRCNSISPARVQTPFVDGFIKKNYPGNEREVFEKLSLSQPIGRMGKVEEVAALALFLCSDEASFITGQDYPIDGGFITLNN